MSIRYRLLLAALPLLFAACHNDDSAAPPKVQVLHASPDAPAVNVLIDGNSAVQNLEYGQGTAYVTETAASHSIEVQAQTPGTATTVIGPTSVSLTPNTIYTVVAEGPVATIGPVIFTRPETTVDSASTRVLVLHAAPNAPSVSVWVTAPGAPLSSSSALGTFTFSGSLGPATVAAGQYEIRVTPGGATTPVLFDSGTITLTGGADLLVAALQNTGPGTAPITLGVVDSEGHNSQILDVGTPANVRIVHDSPNAPAVSVIANNDVASPLVPSLAYESAFPGLSTYASLPAATYAIAVTPASNPSDAVISASLALAAGSVQSVYAVGLLANISALVTSDDDRRLATQAKLRIIHGSPSAGPVDIYLTAPGAGIASATPAYANVAFKDDTGFVSYKAGSYDVTVTPTGSKTPAIGPATVTIKNAGIYTAVARDAVGGGVPLGLILLDDFAAGP
jgi:hypothetical protein